MSARKRPLGALPTADETTTIVPRAADATQARAHVGPPVARRSMWVACVLTCPICGEMHTHRVGDPARLAAGRITRRCPVTGRGYLLAPVPRRVRELLTHADRAAIRSLISPRQRLRPEHGDTHAANFLLGTAGVGVVDLEHLARHLAGHDWALMHLLWGPTNPWLSELLLRRAERDHISGAYAANLALLACREWTIHHNDPASRHLQSVLDSNLRMAREHLHRIYSLSW